MGEIHSAFCQALNVRRDDLARVAARTFELPGVLIIDDQQEDIWNIALLGGV